MTIFSIKTHTIIYSFIFISSVCGSEKNPGTIQASEHVQKHAQQIAERYITRKLLKPGTTIVVKEMSEKYINGLESSGVKTWNNALNNGHDTIWIDPYHEHELSERAKDSRMAHEIAHIVLNQKPYLNPFFWAHKVHDGAFYISFGSLSFAPLIPVGAGTVGSAAYNTIKNPKKTREHIISLTKNMGSFNKTIVGAALGIACSWYTNYRLNKDIVEFDGTPLGYHYRSMEKPHEILCDVLAATILPGGPKAGYALYSEVLDYHKVDLPGTDHPSLSTRIAYHNLMDRIQSAKLGLFHIDPF